MNLIQIYLISKQNSIHLLLNAGAICVQYSLANVTGNVRQLFMCNWNLSYNIHVQLLGSTVVSRIYAPRFATLAPVESVGGLICGI